MFWNRMVDQLAESVWVPLLADPSVEAYEASEGNHTHLVNLSVPTPSNSKNTYPKLIKYNMALDFKNTTFLRPTFSQKTG